jgi:hypothetical protein
MKFFCFLRFIAAGSLTVALAGVLVPYPVFGQVQDPIFDPILGPAVRIISPANHEFFFAPADIPIIAYTRPEVAFTNVEFYANGVDLGPGTELTVTNRAVYKELAEPSTMPSTVIGRLRGLWCFDWTNAPTGTYALTAVASGNEVYVPSIQINRTSAPVNITILQPVVPPTPTNVVDIVASDPVAIAGTNISWVWPGVSSAVPVWSAWPPPSWKYFTNWGPKVALFTVRRFGDASSAVTVNYNIGGTASNGVDYVALPGYVSISAGSYCAHIPVVPVDNGSNSIPKTVILTLQPSTNTTPDYLVGIPPFAEVVILHHWPRPLPLLLPDRSFHFNGSGPDGAWFVLQNSTDLVNWTSTCTNQVLDGSIDFIDPGAASNWCGFYRIFPLDGPPDY